MKVAFLVQDLPPIRYFVNRLCRGTDSVLVVVERPEPKRRIPSSPFDFMRRVLEGVEAKISQGRSASGERATLNRLFGEDWKEFGPSLPTIQAADINSGEVLQALEVFRPDLILDHGTSIVRDHILDTAPLALNLHWGLSPYYRGVRCTEWALLHWDPFNIGVTIHRLSREIDGGDILAQARIDVENSDTVHSINMKLTKRGTALLESLLDRMRKGESPTFRKQELSDGVLTYSRQWSIHLDRHVRRIERGNGIARMLSRPARTTRLPIVDGEESDEI